MKKAATIGLGSFCLFLLHGCGSYDPCSIYKYNGTRQTISISIYENEQKTLNSLNASVRELHSGKEFELSQYFYGVPINVLIPQSIYIISYKDSAQQDTIVLSNYSPRSSNKQDYNCGFVVDIDEPTVEHTFSKITFRSTWQKNQQVQLTVIR